jgi:hypothetical protein
MEPESGLPGGTGCKSLEIKGLCDGGVKGGVTPRGRWGVAAKISGCSWMMLVMTSSLSI